MVYIGALIMFYYSIDTALQYPVRVCMPPPLNRLNILVHEDTNMQQQIGMNKSFLCSFLKISFYANTSYTKRR